VGIAAELRLAVLILALTAGAAGSACSSVMYVRSPANRVFTEPTYESSKPFFFLGLVGPDQHVFVDQICLGKDADQIVTAYTGSDVLSTVLTLGIYAPRTVKVWCQL
jgi:hypothetical protein